MTLSYINPVYPEYFADPFILEQEGMYYAYGTGPTQGDRVLPALSSPNLVDWTAHGGVLVPPAGSDEWWAPEVAFFDGMYYLYYSAKGIDKRDHQLRVAYSAHPLGPFEDCGRVLVPDQPFTIDAHPFRDEDGVWYLFYAQDFLTLDGDTRVGTGIVVDRLVDMLTLAGEPHVVVRPHLDWHLFKAQRVMYGGVHDWHTVEGPSVLRHEGRYYCFYSGGAWEQETYGVSYVSTDHPLGLYTSPLETSYQVLRSLPPHVMGPGHNSFVRSRDGQLLMVYHAWDAARTGRYMRLDKLVWKEGVPHVSPTWTPTTL